MSSESIITILKYLSVVSITVLTCYVYFKLSLKKKTADFVTELKESHEIMSQVLTVLEEEEKLSQ